MHGILQCGETFRLHHRIGIDEIADRQRLREEFRRRVAEGIVQDFHVAPGDDADPGRRRQYSDTPGLPGVHDKPAGTRTGGQG